MRHLATKDVFRHWRRLRGRRRAPDRRSLNPAALGAALPDVFLLECAEGIVRVRLAGTRVCALFGGELRGLAFESLFSHASAADLAEILAAVLTDQSPAIAGLSALFPDRVSAEAELLLLPLTNDHGDGAPRILGVLTARGHRPSRHPPCAALEVIAFRILPDEDDAGAMPETGTPLRRKADTAAQRRARFRIYQGGAA